ncbi:MAG: hypothetical protein K0R63_380 [Rickettsiales bacterium]|jgi:hypothetical protein|nr:hypothetical protein [Rickettsiales bacterium]
MVNLTNKYGHLEAKIFHVDGTLPAGSVQMIDGFNPNNPLHIIDFSGIAGISFANIGVSQLGNDTQISFGEGKSVVIGGASADEIRLDQLQGIRAPQEPTLLSTHTVYHVSADKMAAGGTFVIDTLDTLPTGKSPVIMLEGFGNRTVTNTQVIQNGSDVQVSLGSGYHLEIKGATASNVMSWINNDPFVVQDPSHTFVAINTHNLEYGVNLETSGQYTVLPKGVSLYETKTDDGFTAQDAMTSFMSGQSAWLDRAAKEFSKLISTVPA